MRYWLAGIATCAVGLILARVISPTSQDPIVQLVLFIFGAALCIAGLGIIIVGIRKNPVKK